MLQIMVAAWITIEVERSREGRVDWHVVEGLRREHGVELVVRPRLWLVIESFISIRLYSSALMAVVIDMIVLALLKIYEASGCHLPRGNTPDARTARNMPPPAEKLWA